MKKIIPFLLILMSCTKLLAQDKIYKLKGTVINAKVIEIGIDEVKYKLFDNPDGPIYVVDKSSLNRIEFADGRVEKYKLSIKDPENYDGQLTKAIKFNFFSPLLGYTQFSFEKSISPLTGYELSAGIIGAGKNEQLGYYNINGIGTLQPYTRDAFGGFIEAGYKFKKLPNFFNRGVRMTHIMQGTYIKPTFTLGYYGDNILNNKTGDPIIEKRHTVFGALILNFGHQWVFGDKFLVDVYYGLGYAFDNTKSGYDDYYRDVYNHFIIQKAGSGASLGASFGLKIGLLIK